MYLDLPKPLTPFPQRGPWSSHAPSPPVWKCEQRLNTVWICGKYPFNSTQGWHSIITFCSITTEVLRCSKLSLTLLSVWTISRSRLGPYSVLQILYKYLCSPEGFILHLCFFINQEEALWKRRFSTPVFRILKNTDQIFLLWKYCKKQRTLKKSCFPGTGKASVQVLLQKRFPLIHFLSLALISKLALPNFFT